MFYAHISDQARVFIDFYPFIAISTAKLGFNVIFLSNVFKNEFF
jgi:hypothetical protein